MNSQEREMINIYEHRNKFVRKKWLFHSFKITQND